MPSKDLKKFLFDGKEKTEPIDVFLNIPNPANDDQSGSLIMEIINVLGETSNLTGDELKNFVARPDGFTSDKDEDAHSA